MARWMWALAILVFLYYVVSRHLQIEILVASTRRGIWYDLVLALLLQALYFINQAAFYAALSRLTRHRLDGRKLLLPVLAANFVNAATPTGLVAGTYIIVDEARREGMPETEALIISGLYLLLDYNAFLIVLAAGLVPLYLTHRLTRIEWIAAGLLTVGVAIVGALLATSIVDPAGTTRRVLSAAMKVHDRLARFRLFQGFSREKVTAAVKTLEDSMNLIRKERRKLALPLFHAFAVEGIGIATLYAIFLAFRVTPSLGALITGYAVGTLFMIVSITPAGLGIVEGTMILSFTSFGVPPGAAAIVTLVYRGLTFWLPFVAGFLAFRRQ